MNVYQKLDYILSPAQKKQVLILGGLLLIGMLFEMIGLGILIPAIGIMLNPDIGKQYPVLKPYLSFLGHPTQLQLVTWLMGIIVFVYLIKSVFLIFISWRQSKFATELSAGLGRKLFKGYLEQPYSFHLQRNSAILLRNIQGEISQFTTISQSAITFTLELSIVVGIAVLLILAEPLGALVVTLFLLVSAVIFHRLTKKKLLFWGKQKQLFSGLVNQHLLQGFGGVKDIKILGREKQFLEEYNVHNVAYSRILTKISTLNLVPRSYLEFLAVTGLSGLIILMVLQGKPLNLLVPTIGVFVAAAFRMIPSVNRIMSATQMIRFSRPVLDMLYDEFHLINNDSNQKSDAAKISFSKSIEITNLDYHYADTVSKALDSVTVCIKKGESVGFIGPSGSGKSTLVDLILGLLTPACGEIRVDGQDIQKNLRGWQNQIGYVPQSIYLTDDSLRRNVAFGILNEEIDKKAVDRAIKAAQLDEFVQTLPQGLDTFVGERGVRLSGGQRQRIGIARALYHNPSILVLDEATSALDSVTEREVMRAVNALKGDKTLLIVAHRLSTLENCTKIYKLHRGKVVEQHSSHENVLK